MQVLDYRTKFWNIIDNGSPKLFGSYGIISMNEYMTHTLYDIPFYLLMRVTEILSQLIDGLTDNFNVLYKSEKYYGICHYGLLLVFILAL